MRPSPFLRTRVARRILILFLVCAILPLTALATLGYRQVAADLVESELQRLRDEAKTSGMMVLDRLSTLASALDHFTWLIQAGRPLPKTDLLSAAETSGPRFRAVVLVRGDGSVEPLQGQVPDLPSIRSAQLEHLRRGGTALVTAPGTDGPWIFLVHEIASIPGARLWGWVDGTSLWGFDGDNGVAPTGTSLCLSDVQIGPIVCPFREQYEAQAQGGGVASFFWQHGDDRYIAGQWTLFLNRTYASPAWILSLGTPKATVFEPLWELRSTFVMGLALALAIVFALSHIQLRRSMYPLEALEAGTRRVAEGRFEEPVVVGSDDEFGDLASAFNRMAGELARLFRQGTALEAVHQAALRASGAQPVLHALLDRRRDLIPGDGLSVALARPDDPSRWTVTHEFASGGGELPAREFRPRPAEIRELEAAKDGLVARRGERARSYFPRPEQILQREILVLPLCRGGSLSGAIVIPCLPEQEGRPEALAESRHAADRVAVAIAHAQAVEQLDALNWGALTALARTIDAVSPWTAGHSERVTVGALEVGQRLGLSQEDLDLLHRGGLLHDIGKVGVPTAILDKPGKLTAEEYAAIQAHPTIGARILAPIGPFRPALPLVLHHHELLDGSGYPEGLAGDQIPLLVRILTVADVFDALISDRPYRAAWPVERAIAYLRENIGRKFDLRAVEALAAAVATGWRPQAGHSTRLTDPDTPGRYRLSPAHLPKPQAELTV
jgi:HAMP domain-containing protein